ncbi:GntR family transcriptional regulator [Paenibacillus sp. TRM 82003]|nr:GntR family transcriptional regulator [Paenibacillus sp. TRM 82003]
MAVRAQSKQQTAYEFIHSRIINGRFQPGYRIVVDQIVQELALSPSPIREAIRKLEADGFLENKPYCGVVVKSLEDKECLERMSALALLEGYATAQSASLLTRQQLQELAALNERMAFCLEQGDFMAAGSIDREFHDRLMARCDNEFIMDNIRSILEKLNAIRRLNLMFYPLRMRESIKEHRELLQFIEQRRSPEDIERFIRLHKNNAIAAYKKSMSELEQ